MSAVEREENPAGSREETVWSGASQSVPLTHSDQAAAAEEEPQPPGGGADASPLTPQISKGILFNCLPESR